MNQGHQASGHVNVTRRKRHWRLVIRDTGWGIQAQAVFDPSPSRCTDLLHDGWAMMAEFFDTRDDAYVRGQDTLNAYRLECCGCQQFRPTGTYRGRFNGKAWHGRLCQRCAGNDAYSVHPDQQRVHTRS
jgi:hypothetical protein